MRTSEFSICTRYNVLTLLTLAAVNLSRRRLGTVGRWCVRPISIAMSSSDQDAGFAVMDGPGRERVRA